jgi:hypothetical protein
MRLANQAAPALAGAVTRLSGGDERSEIVQWTISAKNAAPVARLGGRRGLMWRGPHQARRKGIAQCWPARGFMVMVQNTSRFCP